MTLNRKIRPRFEYLLLIEVIIRYTLHYRNKMANMILITEVKIKEIAPTRSNLSDITLNSMEFQLLPFYPNIDRI